MAFEEDGVSNFALFPKKEKGLTSDTDRFACQEALELNALNMKYMSLSAILIAFCWGSIRHTAQDG